MFFTQITVTKSTSKMGECTFYISPKIKIIVFHCILSFEHDKTVYYFDQPTYKKVCKKHAYQVCLVLNDGIKCGFLAIIVFTYFYAIMSCYAFMHNMVYQTGFIKIDNVSYE